MPRPTLLRAPKTWHHWTNSPRGTGLVMAADTLSKDRHPRAMGTMRVLPYVSLLYPHPALSVSVKCRSRPLRSFAVSPPREDWSLPIGVTVNGQGDDRHGRAPKIERIGESKNHYTSALLVTSERKGLAELEKYGWRYDFENEQMQYQQGQPQQVVVKEKKKNQGCLAIW